MTDHKIRRFSAGDVVDQRGDIVERIHDPLFRDLIIGTLNGAITMRDPKTGMPRHRNAFAHVPALVSVHIRIGELFRVSADMTELIRHAAALLDDTDQWESGLLPTEAGFVRFDSPLPIMDARGNTMLIHAMSWGPADLAGPDGKRLTEQATFVTMWNDVDVEPDHYATIMLEDPLRSKFRKIAGRWSFIGAEVLTNGIRMGPALIDPAQLRTNYTNASADDGINTPFTNTFRLIMAMCMLMDQTIVTKTTEKPNVHARRRAKDRKLSQSDITVVTLRRAYRKDDDGFSASTGTSREWHHRWVVRGHWRWARVGEGRQQIRRVWVAGHVKGPEDKPLKITQKVYDLKR